MSTSNVSKECLADPCFRHQVRLLDGSVPVNQQIDRLRAPWLWPEMTEIVHPAQYPITIIEYIRHLLLH